MSKEKTDRLNRRALAIQKEINDLDKDGYRLNSAIPMVAGRYFLSEKTVYKDYYKTVIINKEPQPANPPANDNNYPGNNRAKLY
jgi:hypothetical protein